MISDLAFKKHIQSAMTGETVRLMTPVKLDVTAALEPMENTIGQRYRTELRLYFEQTFRDGLQYRRVEDLENMAVLALQRELFDDVARELRKIQIMIWEQQQPVSKEIEDRIENLYNVLTR